jgi:hypothetical protein
MNVTEFLVSHTLLVGMVTFRQTATKAGTGLDHSGPAHEGVELAKIVFVTGGNCNWLMWWGFERVQRF